MEPSSARKKSDLHTEFSSAKKKTSNLSVISQDGENQRGQNIQVGQK